MTSDPPPPGICGLQKEKTSATLECLIPFKGMVANVLMLT
jgi:hypothetical protein